MTAMGFVSASTTMRGGLTFPKPSSDGGGFGAEGGGFVAEGGGFGAEGGGFGAEGGGVRAATCFFGAAGEREGGATLASGTTVEAVAEAGVGALSSGGFWTGSLVGVCSSVLDGIHEGVPVLVGLVLGCLDGRADAEG